MTAEAAVMLVGLCLLLGHGAWARRTGPRTTRRLARGRDALHAALEERGANPPELHALAVLPRRLQIAVLAGVASSLAGAQRRRLTALAQDLSILTHAAARCRSRWWWRRLQGARIYTLLGGGDASVPALLGDRRPEVRAQVAQWAVEHHNDQIVDLLLRMLDVDDGSTRFAVKDSLIRIGRPVTERLALHLSVRSGRSLVPAMEVAVALPDPVLLPAALTLGDDEEAPIRALAAALAGAIGGGPAVELLTTLLRDDAPEVRAAAARGLGRAGHWPAAASLVVLLSDRSWEVRQKAAVALRTLGSPGMLFLRRAISAPDPFAADAARQMLDLPDSALRTLR